MVPTEHAEARIERNMLFRTYIPLGSMQTCYLELTNPIQEIVYPPGDPLGRISLRRSRALQKSKNKRKRQQKEALVQEPEKKDKKRKTSMAKKVKKGCDCSEAGGEGGLQGRRSSKAEAPG